MDRIRSRLGKSALAVVVITCAVIFLVFGLLGSLGLVLSNGVHWFEGIDWSQFGVRIGAGRTIDVDDTVRHGLSEFGGINRIVIETVSTDPAISTIEGDSLEATLKGTCRSFTEPVSLVGEKSGDTLTIRIKYPVTGVTAEDLTYTVAIPKSFVGDLSVVAVSADVRLQDLSFTCKDLSATTISGDITVAGLSADTYSFSTTSGAIDAKDLTGETDAHSISGDVLLAEKQPMKTTADTVSGGITMVLPADAAFSFAYETVSGGFSSDFSIMLDKDTRTETSGSVGSGGPAFKVQSVSGAYRIRIG